MLKSQKHEYALDQAVVTVGRDKSNSICINSNLVSKFHAKILPEDRILIDLQSRNGTYVNQRRIHNQHTVIVSGDVIRFGDFEEDFRFVDPRERMAETVVHQPLADRRDQRVREAFRAAPDDGQQCEDQLMRCGKVHEVMQDAVQETVQESAHHQEITLTDSQLSHVETPTGRTRTSARPVLATVDKQAQNDAKQRIQSLQQHCEMLQSTILAAIFAIKRFEKEAPPCSAEPLMEALAQLHHHQKKRQQRAEREARDTLLRFKATNAYYARIKQLEQRAFVSKELASLNTAMQRAEKTLSAASGSSAEFTRKLQDEMIRLQLENDFLRKQNQQLLQANENGGTIDLLAWHDEIVRLAQQMGELARLPQAQGDDTHDIMLALSMCFPDVAPHSEF